MFSRKLSSINLSQSLLLELILGTAALSVDALKGAAVAHAQVCAPSLILALLLISAYQPEKLFLLKSAGFPAEPNVL